MNKYIQLFKAVPVSKRTDGFSTHFIKHGVLVEHSVVGEYGNHKLLKLINDLVPTNAEMNKSFHKSWKKVRDASLQQLVAEQVMHYFSTYSLQNLGLYSDATVFIPNEELKLEEKGGITFLILKGITATEIAEKVQVLLSSGIALSESDLNDLVFVIQDQKLSVDLETVKNKEMKVRLYSLLKITPKDPVEYLRLQIYNATASTLLIKSPEVICLVKLVEENVFEKYETKYGLENLASIFYRFKPLFLAFKNKQSAKTVNRIRKLAVKYHVPVPEDSFGFITRDLRNNTFKVRAFNKSLTKANIFRKIKLMQSLRFYSKDVSGIVYPIRNGKVFISTTSSIENVNRAITPLSKSLSKDLQHLAGKTVFLDADLATPTSGKMFVGDVPNGSSFTTKDSLVLGVSWKDINCKYIDLDLSIISIAGKMGWDGSYRNNNFLFSGDITSAPEGATEAYLVRKDAADGIYLLNLNYYNAYNTSAEAPFTLFLTEENEYKRMNKNSMLSRDKMLFWTKSIIDYSHKQKFIGVLKIHSGIKTFYIFESRMNRSISACLDDKSVNMIDYYDKYLESILSLKTLLEWANVSFVNDPKEADIDLSLNTLTKDKLINLIVGE